MATNEPMSDNMLDAINDLLHDGRGDIPDLWVSQLFDEACRARAREQALAAENEQKQAQIDAMRPIVERVTEDVTDSETGDCCFCGWSGYPHERNCPTAQARAFVAAHPTDTAVGEAESEGE